MRTEAVPLVPSIDAHTGRVVEQVVPETSATELDQIMSTADASEADFSRLGRRTRASMLRDIARRLDGDREQIVASADRETALGQERLSLELTRTAFQLDHLADAVADGGYLEAIIDHRRRTPVGLHPDLRRMLVPLGTIGVFGASNFPLAFSVAGGDVAAALAVGCPVVYKAHPSHPATSQVCARHVLDAVAACGAPGGTFAVIHGNDAAHRLVLHAATRGVAFTGSLATGRMIADWIARRDEPIPFYAELSSVNPVLIGPVAAAQDPDGVVKKLVAAVTTNAGQMCTKPAVVLLPSGPPAQVVVDRLVAQLAEAPRMTLLNDTTLQGFRTARDELACAHGVEPLLPASDAGRAVRVALAEVDADDFGSEHTRECFGPSTLLVRYGSVSQAIGALKHITSGSLGASLLVDEEDEIGDVLPMLSRTVGRIVFGGLTPGVAVSWAQHHGGPWPSTNSQHSSVGATGLRRFLRPLAWQDAPASSLPVELTDDYRGIPRRVDGVMTLDVHRKWPDGAASHVLAPRRAEG